MEWNCQEGQRKSEGGKMRYQKGIEDLDKYLSTMEKPGTVTDLMSSPYVETLVTISSDDGNNLNYYCLDKIFSLLFTELEQSDNSLVINIIIEDLIKRSYRSSNILSQIYFKLCLADSSNNIITILRLYIALSSRLYSNAISGNSDVSDLNIAFSLCFASSIAKIELIFESSVFLLYDLLESDLYIEKYHEYLSVIANNKSYLSHIKKMCRPYPEVNRYFSSLIDAIKS
jgi:hypothetical protein